MKLTIHRGSHEIGGSCVELVSNSGGTRIILDVGMPLVASDRTPFDWKIYRSLSQAELLDQRVIPPVVGLYRCQKRSVSAVILSHAHQDHYGFIRFIHPDIPLYMSPGTKSLVEVSNLFLDTSVNLKQARIFTMWQTFQVGEFAVTPYLMDHSAPDAAAFLVEADGQRLFYTGDFRGHGRKRILLERFVRHPMSCVDCLLMEGSMMGRDEGPYPGEDAVEEAIYKVITNQQSYTFIFCSSQNLDRLVSIYRATRRAGRTLVIDLYTAFVLDKISTLSPSIPQFDWREVRVLFAHSHAKKLAELDVRLLYRYKKAKIEVPEIRDASQKMVILSKDNPYFRILASKLGAEGRAKSIYSMWHGYLERSNLTEFLKSRGIELLEIHTSGHAYVQDLRRLAEALNPRMLIPIHTFYPERYLDIWSNTIQLEDGQTHSL